MFIATLEGIYRHGIIGISEDIKIVEKIAIESLLLEIDDYHEVDISIANLNERMNDVKFIKRYFRRGKIYIVQQITHYQNHSIQ